MKWPGCENSHIEHWFMRVSYKRARPVRDGTQRMQIALLEELEEHPCEMVGKVCKVEMKMKLGRELTVEASTAECRLRRRHCVERA